MGPLQASPRSHIVLGAVPPNGLEDDPEPSELVPESSPKPVSRTDIESVTRNAVRRKWKINSLLVVGWYLSSTTISLYNKWLFSQFRYAIFATSIHMLIQFTLSYFTLTTFMMRKAELKMFLARVPLRDYVKLVIPCAVATGFDIGLSCKSLEYVPLSFYTMVKSSVPVWVVIFAVLFGLERFTYKLAAIITTISVGVLMTVARDPSEGETVQSRSFAGLLMVLVGSMMSGLRWSMTRFLMKHPHLGIENPILTNLLLTPMIFLTVLTVSISAEEIHEMITSHYFSTPFQSIKSLLMLSVAGVLAFCLMATEFYLIQRTSVVTLSVAGIFKEVLTILLALLIFGERIGPLNVAGLVVSIGGIAWYNYWRWRLSMLEEREKLEETSQGEEERESSRSDSGPLYDVTIEDAKPQRPSSTKKGYARLEDVTLSSHGSPHCLSAGPSLSP